jgi:hypothetical protein
MADAQYGKNCRQCFQVHYKCRIESKSSMIYISVDNDHHGGLALQWIKKLKFDEQDVTFLLQVSSRNNLIPQSSFRKITLPGHPLSDGHSYRNPMSYIRSLLHQRLIRRSVEFKKGDLLLIITEYQLNNALFAQLMRLSGGKIYLVDEGISFYFNNSPLYARNVKLAEEIYLSFYNLAFHLLGIPTNAKKGFEGRMYLRIFDRYIDKIYSGIRLPVSRKEEVKGYRNLILDRVTKIDNDEQTAIFFATNLSTYGLKDEDISLSKLAIEEMSKKFKNVYVKIHPADFVQKNEAFWIYQEIISCYSNVSLIDNSGTGNDAIERLKPNIVVGSIGASLFDAFFFGCHPIFLFPLLRQVPEFQIYRHTLDQLGYRFINEINHISPDYRCQIDIAKLLYEDDILC